MLMKVVMVLNEFRPYGGMQRDCVRMARECVARGHRVTIVTRAWQGDPLQEPGIEVALLGQHGRTNAQRDRRFIFSTQAWLAENPHDVSLAFLRMPGLDAYFAADPCYEAKVRRLKPAWFRWTPRYRRFASQERTIFEAGKRTQVMLLHPGEVTTFQELYDTEPERLHVLPPGIRRPESSAVVNDTLRHELGLSSDSQLTLMVGSGFRTKGVDRAIAALPNVPKAHLVIAGQDKAMPFLTQAAELKVSDRVHFLGGRDDVDRLMCAADMLVHPAYSENTGTVLLEALVRGLPVIASEVCGFAYHLSDSAAGIVLPEPFDQGTFNAALQECLQDDTKRLGMREAGLAYGLAKDLYSCHHKAVDLLEQIARSP